MNQTSVLPISIHSIKAENNNSNKWVLFIPGAVNSAEEIESNLKDAKFNYFILSLRGRGNSDVPTSGYSLKDQASDIVSFINSLEENIELTVFAHSVGVPISIIAIHNLKRKVKAFVMCEFAPFYPPFDKNWADNVKKQKLSSISNIAVDGIVKDAVYTDVAKELSSINSELYLLTGNNQFSALRDKEKEALKKMIPQISISSIDGGHDLLIENNNGTLDFINSVVK